MGCRARPSCMPLLAGAMYDTRGRKKQDERACGCSLPASVGRSWSGNRVQQWRHQGRQGRRNMAPRTDTAPTVASEGVEIAQGVLFSEKLWSRLGAKARDMQKQLRRERMGDTSEVPDAPTAVFNHHFARDATWKQR